MSLLREIRDLFEIRAFIFNGMAAGNLCKCEIG